MQEVDAHQLIRWRLARATARGCYLVQLSTHQSRVTAQRFDESLGFQKTHVGMKLFLGAETAAHD